MISYLLFGVMFLRFWKRHVGDGRCQTPKTGPEPTKPRLFLYVSNNYRIEVKHIFLAIVYLGLSCEFFSEFWYFPYCRPPAENKWQCLLRREFYWQTQTWNLWSQSFKSSFNGNSRSNQSSERKQGPKTETTRSWRAIWFFKAGRKRGPRRK